MAKGIKELRLRIRSIKNTKKITRAMEMVSAAKLRRVQTAMEGNRTFTRRLELLLGRLALSPVAGENPLFETRDDSGLPPLLVLFTADRGLCGAFNGNLIKMAQKYLKANPDALLFCIGKKGRDFFKKRIGDRLVGSIVDLNNRLDGALTDEIGNALLSRFRDRLVSRIDIIAPEFVSTSTNRPRQSRYLPLEAGAFGLSDEEKSQAIDYLLEPSPARVFEALLPRYLVSKIFLALAECYTCEHSSRMLAMNAASKNCDDLSRKLTLEMNKARQAGITTEIMEIISGAEALNG